MLSSVWLFETLRTVTHQVPLSLGFPSKNTGVGCHFLLQENFPTQGSNLCLLCLLHCRRILYPCTTRETHNLFRWPHNKFLLEFNIEKKKSLLTPWQHLYIYHLLCRFWIVLLEKTLQSPLDSKDIKLVSPKGNQTWIFIGKTDAEAEAPILWPPDAKSRLIGKDANAGKDWNQKEKRVAEDEMVG